MSFDLYVWRSPRYDPDGFLAALERFETDPDAFDPSPDVVAFRRDLVARYTALEDLPDEEVDDGSPWSMSPSESDRVVGMWLRGNSEPAVIESIATLSEKHRLFLYDPQGHEVHEPRDPAPWKVSGIGRLIERIFPPRT